MVVSGVILDIVKKSGQDDVIVVNTCAVTSEAVVKQDKPFVN